MKITKKITDNVILANRRNAQKSSGPTNTERTSQNARTHGVLSQKLWFHNDEERSDFNALVNELCAGHRPCGPTEYAQVFEMAIDVWHLRTLYGLQVQEMANISTAANKILNTLGENYDSEQVALLAGNNGSGWDCPELVVRTGSRTSEQEEGLESTPLNKAGQVIVEAKMTRTIELIQRYIAGIKRDYHRALSKLQELQRERRELECWPMVTEGSDEK